jgi:heme exporter protein A
VLALRDVDTFYGRLQALHGVSLDVPNGSVVAILGANGAGKSTLLRVLSTLERPRRGDVLWQGRAADAEARRGIGLVAHESLCYADLSARENLRFFGNLYGVTEVGTRVDGLLARVALEHAADRPARTYSRGMLQRLSVARALVHAPSLLLLDEPFTGLDRQGVVVLARLLAEEKARGVAMVVVSHDLPAIAALVDRALVLERGKIDRELRLGADDRLAALERLYDAGPVAGAA